MLAAREAVDDARLDLNTLRVGLISSTSVGGMDLSEHFYNAFKKDNRKGRLREVISHDCADAAAKLPSFSKASRIINTSSSGFIHAPLQCMRRPAGVIVYSSGITSGSGYWYSNPSSLQIRLPSIILPLPLSRLFLNCGGSSPSKRAICG